MNVGTKVYVVHRRHYQYNDETYDESGWEPACFVTSDESKVGEFISNDIGSFDMTVSDVFGWKQPDAEDIDKYFGGEWEWGSNFDFKKVSLQERVEFFDKYGIILHQVTELEMN